jgi:hypothetical protein
MAVNLVQNPDGSASFKNEIDGVETWRVGGVPASNAVNASASVDGTYAFRGQKWAIMPLNAAAGVGAALASFKNTEARAVYLTHYLIDIQTGSSASCTCKVDVGTLATSSGTTVVTALDLSNVLLASGGWDGTAGAKPRVKVAVNSYVNCIMVSGSATGLVGQAVIGYIVS